jgi:hypothetical protein
VGNAEEVCRGKSDEELEAAFGVLHEYQPDFRKAILAELAQRSLQSKAALAQTPAPEANNIQQSSGWAEKKPTSSNQGDSKPNKNASPRAMPMLAFGGILVAIGIALIALAPGPSAVMRQSSFQGIDTSDVVLDTSAHKIAVAGGAILIIAGVGLAAAGVSQSKQSSTNINSSPADTATGYSSVEDRLRNVDEIYKKHVITEKEYKKARADVLSQL